MQEPRGWRSWRGTADRADRRPSPSSHVRALLARASLAWDGADVVAVANRNIIMVPPQPRPFAGRYDPDRARWTPIGTPRQLAGSLTWTGGAILASGSEAYDPATDRWLRLPDPPKADGAQRGWIGREPAILRWAADSGTIYVLAPAKP